MKVKNSKVARRLNIKKRIRSKVFGTLSRPRITLFKSNTSIYVQLIDDEQCKTLLFCSLASMKVHKNTVEGAWALGKCVAEQALAKGIQQVVFDRSGYIYHGKVKALADGAREHGLKF